MNNPPSSPEAMRSDGWRPIETAPKDRFVLVYTPADGEMNGFVAMAKWQGGSWYGVDDEGLTFNPLQAWDHTTHWRPLPPPPEAIAPGPPSPAGMVGVGARIIDPEAWAEISAEDNEEVAAIFAEAWEEALAKSRAFILALREPTYEMLAAADSALPRFEAEPDGSRMMGVDGAELAWRAMIDVAAGGEG